MAPGPRTLAWGASLEVDLLPGFWTLVADQINLANLGLNFTFHQVIDTFTLILPFKFSGFKVNGKLELAAAI